MAMDIRDLLFWIRQGRIKEYQETISRSEILRVAFHADSQVYQGKINKLQQAISVERGLITWEEIYAQNRESLRGGGS